MYAHLGDIQCHTCSRSEKEVIIIIISTISVHLHLVKILWRSSNLQWCHYWLWRVYQQYGIITKQSSCHDYWLESHFDIKDYNHSFTMIYTNYSYDYLSKILILKVLSTCNLPSLLSDCHPVAKASWGEVGERESRLLNYEHISRVKEGTQCGHTSLRHKLRL